MNKLREDFRVGILGAVGGLFSISIVLMIARVDEYYAYLSWLHETSNYNPYDRGGAESLWWVPVTIWHLILSVATSLLAHRYLTTRLKSPFLLWQVIGTASLLGWGLTVLLVAGIDCLMTGNLYASQHTFTSGNIAEITKYVSVGFASNVFYGSVMKASSRQYTTQFDELSCDSNVDHLLTTS